jgi:hypothetical protein
MSENKYIEFVEVGSSSRKVYDVISKKNKLKLATIGYYNPWNQYCLITHGGTIWNNECLASVLEFMESIK